MNLLASVQWTIYDKNSVLVLLLLLFWGGYIDALQSDFCVAPRIMFAISCSVDKYICFILKICFGSCRLVYFFQLCNIACDQNIHQVMHFINLILKNVTFRSYLITTHIKQWFLHLAFRQSDSLKSFLV